MFFSKNKSIIIFLLGIGLLFWFTAKVSYASEVSSNDLKKARMVYPLNTMVVDSLFELIPEVAQNRDDELMQLLCQLARNEVKKDFSINYLISKKGVMEQDLLKPESVYHLWVTDNIADQQTACAAYVATSIWLSPENNEFILKQNDDETPSIDPKKLNEVMKVRLAIAKTDAQIFNVITHSVVGEAEQHSLDRLPKEVSFYKRLIKEKFSFLALDYLTKIKENYSEYTEAVSVISLNENNFIISYPKGERLSYQNGELHYLVHGVNWLGGGKVMGTETFVEVSF